MSWKIPRASLGRIAPRIRCNSTWTVDKLNDLIEKDRSHVPSSFNDALFRLNILQAPLSMQNGQLVLHDSKASPYKQGTEGRSRAEDMLESLGRLGYSTADLDNLNVIHVAGTKGKGSTCSFTSRLLCDLYPDVKVGLYTSPHLTRVCERIRVNHAPLPENLFAHYFFQLWKTEILDQQNLGFLPGYFRFLTALAFHVFIQEKVQATVLEVGIGGTFDTTNIVPHPKATGITLIDYDHTHLLGTTLESIAKNKAGIFKRDSPAAAITQPNPQVEEVFRETAHNLGQKLELVPPVAAHTGIPGEHQVQNAGLALHLVDTWAKGTGRPSRVYEPGTSPVQPSEASRKAIARTTFPGRCTLVNLNEKQRVFLDGSHTPESLTSTAAWWNTFEHPGKRVLIFTITSHRPIADLMQSFASQNVAFDLVIFCDYSHIFSDKPNPLDLSVFSLQPPAPDGIHAVLQANLEAAFQQVVRDIPSFAPEFRWTESVEDAVAIARAFGHVDILVSGSMRLVGSVVAVLGDEVNVE